MSDLTKYSNLEICRVCLNEPVVFNLYLIENNLILFKLRSFISVEVSFSSNKFPGLKKLILFFNSRMN